MSKRLLEEAEDDYVYDSRAAWLSNAASPLPRHLPSPFSFRSAELASSTESKPKKSRKDLFLDSIEEDDSSVPVCPGASVFQEVTTVTGQDIKGCLESSVSVHRESMGPPFPFPESSLAMSLLESCRPDFPSSVPFKQADESVVLAGMTCCGQRGSADTDEGVVYSINRFVARRLLDHQLAGVRWLWEKYRTGEGALLADDMGMGKTIQILSLIGILMHKTGLYDEDNERMRERKTRSSHCQGGDSTELRSYLRTPPCLIMCPKTLVDNWVNELRKWGYFIADVLHSRLSGESAQTVLRRAKNSQSEIVLVSYSQLEFFHEELASISWTIVVCDEGHLLKNPDIKLYQQVLSINRLKMRLVATGTPIQNVLRELWSLLHLVDEETFRTRSEFVRRFENPIKLGMRKTANTEEIASATVARQKLMELVDHYVLGRKKKNLSGEDALKGKEEVIVLCDLSPLQRDLYEHCLSLPDFDNVRNHSQPCPCGSQLPRGKCCLHFRIPYRRASSGLIQMPLEIDPRAAIWRRSHRNGEPCDKSRRVICPVCVLLPCLVTLSKIASHPSLLQCDPRIHRAEKQVEMQFFMENALTPSLVQRMGGLQRSSRFVDLCSTDGSGKLKTLQEMLHYFVNNGDRTLVFSLSTQVLDMLQAVVAAQGWTSLRLDGSTAAAKRQQLVDRFNNHQDISIFLISSRAGGLGLNLTSATKVVIFDVDWNPVVDMQSQDRAYRIGQQNQVSVFRLVAKGTIEELAYMRQLYKQQLHGAVPIWDAQRSSWEGTGRQRDSLAGIKPGRFEGVEGHAGMRGELFGIENLFQFSSSSILHTLRSKFSTVSTVVPGKASVLQEAIPVDEASRLIEILAGDDADDQSKPKSAIDMLQNMGINVRNAHLLDDMLENADLKDLKQEEVDEEPVPSIPVVVERDHSSIVACTNANKSIPTLTDFVEDLSPVRPVDLLDIDKRLVNRSNGTGKEMRQSAAAVPRIERKKVVLEQSAISRASAIAMDTPGPTRLASPRPRESMGSSATEQVTINHIPPKQTSLPTKPRTPFQLYKPKY